MKPEIVKMETVVKLKTPYVKVGKLVELFDAPRNTIIRIVEQYGIRTTRDPLHYGSWRYFHRHQVIEIAEVLRLERQGVLKRKGIEKELARLRIMRCHYTYTDENGTLRTYGPDAGKPKLTLFQLRQQGYLPPDPEADKEAEKVRVRMREGLRKKKLKGKVLSASDEAYIEGQLP